VGSPIVLVILQSSPFLDFSWQYDPSTLRPFQAVSPNVNAYRLYYATKLLAEVHAEGSAESLLRISEHKAHFVRWAAMQALFRLDHGRAAERLTAALDDAHPSIRNASRKALDRLATWQNGGAA
jgi:HEAT repeat protein